ncbi:MAG: cytochrome c3 family protein [Thermodesulfovibrionales bacterium]|nr:cytochrome c3 family protein [Thermodesulfovibrionales bacterium]
MRYLLLIGVIVVVLAAAAAYTISETPHNFLETECRDCHVNPDKDPLMLIGSITQLCGRCHKRTIRASSHPVDIEPRIARVPDDLPLRDGRVTCSTCHNVHGDARLVFGIKSYFMRRPTADMKFFCITCHEENRAKPGHKELVTIAHMGGQFTVTDPYSLLDPLSIECIGCHDGTSGGNSRFSLGEGRWLHEDGMSHPIGVHYGTARMQAGGLVPVSNLDRKLRFFAGKIGCGTCHDMYSTLTAKLVMPNDESRLCTSCHYDK